MAVAGAAEAVAAIEADIAGWTSAADLAQGRRCQAQAEGVVTAGVPIGTAAFLRETVSGVLAMHDHRQAVAQGGHGHRCIRDDALVGEREGQEAQTNDHEVEAVVCL